MPEFKGEAPGAFADQGLPEDHDQDEIATNPEAEQELEDKSDQQLLDLLTALEKTSNRHSKWEEEVFGTLKQEAAESLLQIRDARELARAELPELCEVLVKRGLAVKLNLRQVIDEPKSDARREFEKMTGKKYESNQLDWGDIDPELKRQGMRTIQDGDNGDVSYILK
ncbi:MAG: hypothetical protein WCW66_06195 [Patescibacteria group bacterium]|jgi:hypothetical protein